MSVSYAVENYKDIFKFSTAKDSPYAITERAYKAYNAKTGMFQTEFYKGKLIRNGKELAEMVRFLMKQDEYAFDTEFTTLRNKYKNKDFEFVGCSFYSNGRNFYVPVVHKDELCNIPKPFLRYWLNRLFSKEHIKIIGHNFNAELHALKSIGVEVPHDNFHDSMILMHNLEESEEVGLKSLTARKYNYYQSEFKHLLGTINPVIATGKTKNEKDISMVDTVVSAYYAMDDTYFTYKVYKDHYDKMSNVEEKFFINNQMRFARVLYKMERRGIKVDTRKIKEMQAKGNKVLAELEEEIIHIVGYDIKITSGQHLAEYFFGYEKYKDVYEEVLEPLFNEDGTPQLYKVGERKGEQKYKKVKNKDVIVGREFCGNRDIIDLGYNFKPIETTEKGMPKTGADILEELKYRITVYGSNSEEEQEAIMLIDYINKYRKLAKLVSTYMNNFIDMQYEDGKIHCSFNQAGTKTGRLSSSEPNLQNLPRPLEEVTEDDRPIKSKYNNIEDYKKALEAYEHDLKEYTFWSDYEIRSALIPSKKNLRLVACDYSNLEMRLLAHFTKDELLINMFVTGEDAHSDTAKNMFNLDCEVKDVKKLYPHLRQQAKTINFLLAYGGSYLALSKSLGVSEEEAKVLYDTYFDTYKGVKAYMDRVKKAVLKYGYVHTILGRTRHLEEAFSNDRSLQAFAQRSAINSPIQGSAADVVSSAQIKIEDDEILRELGYKQLIQVHDEIVGECPKENVEEVMERKVYLMARSLPRPLNGGVELLADSDFGETYASAK